MNKRSVRRPRVDLDARGRIATHGLQTPIRVVLHDTESHDALGIRDLAGICNYWQRNTPGYGAHIIVDAEGKSALCADAHRVCYHVQNRNTGAIGIEQVGFARFTAFLWWTRLRQLHKVARWLAHFNKEYGIPLALNPERGVTTHAIQSRIYGGDHYDPGAFYPLRFVVRLARFYRKRGWH